MRMCRFNYGVWKYHKASSHRKYLAWSPLTRDNREQWNLTDLGSSPHYASHQRLGLGYFSDFSFSYLYVVVIFNKQHLPCNIVVKSHICVRCTASCLAPRSYLKCCCCIVITLVTRANISL